MDARHAHAIPWRPMKNSISRRSVLRAGGLAAAASFLPNPSQAETPLEPPSADAALPVRLGLATYTFRKFDSDHVVQWAKELKTPYLNLKDMHLPLTPLDQVAAKAAEYRAAGFTLVAAGNVSLEKDDDDDMRAKFEYMKAANIPIMVCIPTHTSLPRVEKFVKEYNIKVAIHNHGPEQKDFPSPFDVLAAVKDMDPRMGLCMDLGHSLRAGADVVAAIHAAGPRLYDIHIKDLADHTKRESQVAVGEGVMPVREVFHALMETNYKGTVDLEYEIKENDPMPGVVESFAYMRGVLAGMGYK